jgi:hypothetical protein
MVGRVYESDQANRDTKRMAFACHDSIRLNRETPFLAEPLENLLLVFAAPSLDGASLTCFLNYF